MTGLFFIDQKGKVVKMELKKIPSKLERELDEAIERVRKERISSPFAKEEVRCRTKLNTLHKEGYNVAGIMQKYDTMIEETSDYISDFL